MKQPHPFRHVAPSISPEFAWPRKFASYPLLAGPSGDGSITVVALMMAAVGRPVFPDELHGPGLPTLLRRLSA